MQDTCMQPPSWPAHCTPGNHRDQHRSYDSDVECVTAALSLCCFSSGWRDRLLYLALHWSSCSGADNIYILLAAAYLCLKAGHYSVRQHLHCEAEHVRQML